MVYEDYCFLMGLVLVYLPWYASAMTPDTKHVLSVFNHCDLDSYVNGMSWYHDAHDFALSLDGDVKRAAGVIAAMSPQMDWDRNKIVASAIYNGATSGLGLMGSTIKAIRILNGEEPLDVLGGDKVRAFYANILYPDSGEVTPVIDRHAASIAIGMRLPSKSKILGALKGRRYESYAEIYRECAGIIGILPSQVQAITWCQWRK